jgi:hypothetical protein
MAHQSVWCVFQRLPHERCPNLSALCRTSAVALALVRMSEDEERRQGKPPSAWTVEQWTVLGREVPKIESIQQISDVMDPMRAGVLPQDGDDG